MNIGAWPNGSRRPARRRRRLVDLARPFGWWSTTGRRRSRRLGRSMGSKVKRAGLEHGAGPADRAERCQAERGLATHAQSGRGDETRNVLVDIRIHACRRCSTDLSILGVDPAPASTPSALERRPFRPLRRDDLGFLIGLQGGHQHEERPAAVPRRRGLASALAQGSVRRPISARSTGTRSPTPVSP